MPQATRSVLSPNLSQRMRVSKPATVSHGGIVASQSRVASQIGAKVLKTGGHAVDAAVATAFALGVVEPWMSGIGGVGGMLVRDAATGKVSAFDFGGVSPQGLDTADFQLGRGADSDLFGWPAVEGNVNTTGAKAVVAPTQPLGLWTAHRTFGRKDWAGLLAPAVALAEDGPVVDWFTTLMIATAAADLARDAGTAERFLRSGMPPVSHAATDRKPPLRLPMPALARTLAKLAAEGAPALYRGPLAKGISDDIRAMGGYLSEVDLASAHVREPEALQIACGGETIHVLPELTGGPTLAVAFADLAKRQRDSRRGPAAQDYLAYAHAMRAGWKDRFERLGDAGEHSAPTCTTHLTVVDRQGNVVSLTQTLLSLFGARIVLPSSGILMNNGINWFDPRPGGPNALAAGRRVLANYCPAIMAGPKGVMGAGGCGGRKIIPAVFQLLAMRADFGLSLEKLMATPRLDVSGGSEVVLDNRMSLSIQRALARAFDTVLAEPVVYSNPYTMANCVIRQGDVNHGAVEPLQPWCEAVSEEEV
ncbi:MAG: gamma-glutamyltransferase [Beijerinckiaceae bacterium]